MGDQFKWEFEESAEERPPPDGHRGPRTGVLTFWITAIFIIAAVAGTWITIRQRNEKAKAGLIASAQEILDLQRQALSTSDGDLFFSLQTSDPQWFTAQLLPENQAVIRAGLTATNAEDHGEYIWVNAAWEDDKGAARQRILFLEPRAGRLRQAPIDPAFWGNLQHKDYAWGTLWYHAVDDPWADRIGNTIGDSIDGLCQDICLEDRLPLTIVVGDGFEDTAEPGTLYLPSPRLQGLDLDGQPSSLFWEDLDRRMMSYLTPAVIRFAVPPRRNRGADQWIVNYSRLAEEFMALHPEISLEIVEVDVQPPDRSRLAKEFDGAAFVPSEAMLASGLVRSLDDYVDSDPDFDRDDFYDQIWQGAVWHDRTWFMPQAAEMPLLYYDLKAYEHAGFSVPSSRWTWEEMAEDVATIVAGQPQKGVLAWGYLDVGMDTLYSYAYNWNNQCTEETAVFCQMPLSEQNIAAALDWYAQMARQPGQMPDLVNQLSDSFSPTQMASLETMLRDDPYTLLLNFQGSQRKAAVWVDSPLHYEFNLLLAPVGVVSFPGSDRFDGITPLSIHGSFISGNSAYPLAVWEWLKFLSYQSPVPRLIPARVSAADRSGYWQQLPRPLGNVMRTAFPFSRPVTIGEKKMITWPQVADVLSGELTPVQAARKREALRWFGQ
jgi:ABC-type glycerol-3-phosphate transport system substrate-binding protein